MRLANITVLTTLSVAFPCAGWALGLGAIQVDSALSQPLTAQIEVVGATADDLAQLSASIADDEIFRRHGIERPAFLTTAVVTLGRDAQQRPVLLLRSTEAFSEPMVTFLVDLHSPAGELIREYTILLDPPGLTRGAAAIEVAVPAQVTEPVHQPTRIITAREGAASTVETKATGDTYTVTPRDTLDRIVRIAGAHSRTDRHRMMVATYRSNPEAFGTNINFLRSGATLHLPSATQLSAVSAEEGDREVAAQMTAWYARRRVRVTSAAAPAIAVAQPADAQVDANEQKIADLNEQIAETEKALAQVEKELSRPAVAPEASQELAATSAVPAPEPAPIVTPAPVVLASPIAIQDPDETESAPTASSAMRFLPFAALAVGLGLALVGGVWFYRRRHRVKDKNPLDAAMEADLPAGGRSYHLATPLAQSSEAAAAQIGDSGYTRALDPVFNEPTVEVEVSLNQQAEFRNAADTVVLAPQVKARRGKSDKSDESFLLNPEATINTTHVTLSGDLTAQEPLLERRKNPADVIRQTIEREPHRIDLRLKLLELYYVAATQNQRAFLEVARELAKNEKFASAKEWSQIVEMGRKIAPADALFSDKVDDQEVA